MDLIIIILPVVTKDLPISPRFTPYGFLSRCKFSNLTTRQPMVEFYFLTFPRFPLRKKEHKSYFGKDRTHDFRTSRCASYLLDHSGDELHLFWTSGLWTYRPGSHRRKVTHDFSSTFLLRCLPYFFSREVFSRYFPSSTVKSNFVHQRINHSPLVGHLLFYVKKNPKSCDSTGIRTHVPTSEGFEVTN